MNKNLKSQFGTTGLVIAGVRVRVYEGPASLRHLMSTPQADVPAPAGDEQLR
ncbi:hypothetical protein ABIB25_000911 [Nakamurella sp. UYEF19]